MNNAVSPPDYSRFIPVAKALSDEVLRKGRPPYSQTTKALQYSAWRKDIIRVLEDCGYKSVSDHVRNGNNAIVLEANDHQMIRIVKDDPQAEFAERERLAEPSMLQPLFRIKCGGNFLIEILPKVPMLSDIVKDPVLSAYYGGIKEENIPSILRQLVIYHLHHGARFFFDCSADNVTLMRDPKGNFVPVLTDKGSIVDMGDVNRYLHIWQCYSGDDRDIEWYDDHFAAMRANSLPDFEALKEKYEAKNGAIDNYRLAPIYLGGLAKELSPEFDYEGAQREYLKMLRLVPGQANKVISAADFKAFCAERGHSETTDTVWSRIVQHGQYPSEVGTQLEKMKHIPLPHEGFCKRVEEASQAALKNRVNLSS